MSNLASPKYGAQELIITLQQHLAEQLLPHINEAGNGSRKCSEQHKSEEADNFMMAALLRANTIHE